MLSRFVWTRRLLRPRTLPQAPFRTFSSLGITPTLEHAADALRVRRTSLARDARFARLLDNFSSVAAVRDVRAISPSSPERLFAMPIVPELGLPKDTSSGNREFFHVQLSDSRLDAVEHVVRASLEDESPGSVFSGAQGTGKSMLGFMLATHGFLKGWPTVYIVSFCLLCFVRCVCLLLTATSTAQSRRVARGGQSAPLLARGVPAAERGPRVRRRGVEYASTAA